MPRQRVCDRHAPISLNTLRRVAEKRNEAWNNGWDAYQCKLPPDGMTEAEQQGYDAAVSAYALWQYFESCRYWREKEQASRSYE